MSETIVETIFDSIIESIQKGREDEMKSRFGSFRTRPATKGPRRDAIGKWERKLRSTGHQAHSLFKPARN